LHFMRVWWNW